MDDLEPESMDRLEQALNAAFLSWKEENGMEDNCVLTDFMVILHAQGITDEAEKQTQTSIIPKGSVELMMALSEGAHMRFREEYRQSFMPGAEGDF